MFQHYLMGRVDYQMAANDHVTMRSNYFRWSNPHQFAGGPTRGAERYHYSNFTNAQLVAGHAAATCFRR